MCNIYWIQCIFKTILTYQTLTFCLFCILLAGRNFTAKVLFDRQTVGHGRNFTKLRVMAALFIKVII